MFPVRWKIYVPCSPQKLVFVPLNLTPIYPCYPKPCEERKGANEHAYQPCLLSRLISTIFDNIYSNDPSNG